MFSAMSSKFSPVSAPVATYQQPYVVQPQPAPVVTAPAPAPPQPVAPAPAPTYVAPTPAPTYVAPNPAQPYVAPSPVAPTYAAAPVQAYPAAPVAAYTGTYATFPTPVTPYSSNNYAYGMGSSYPYDWAQFSLPFSKGLGSGLYGPGSRS